MSDQHVPPPGVAPGSGDDAVGRAEPTSDQLAELAAQLFDLARAGDARLLDAVDRGAPADLTDWSGNSLLMLAAYHGHAELVTALAARGADVDRLNDRRQSPLAGAIFKGEEQVVDALLAAGADPDLGEPSARATAAFFGREDLSARLAAGGPADSPGARPPGS